MFALASRFELARSSSAVDRVGRRTVVFEDEFFESLNAQVPEGRTSSGLPSRTDLLAYDIPPLMDLLAEDYERYTLPVSGSAGLRVLIQSGRFVQGIVLWTELLDDEIRVFDIEFHHFSPGTDGQHDRS